MKADPTVQVKVTDQHHHTVFFTQLQKELIVLHYRILRALSLAIILFVLGCAPTPTPEPLAVTPDLSTVTPNPVSATPDLTTVTPEPPAESDSTVAIFVVDKFQGCVVDPDSSSYKADGGGLEDGQCIENEDVEPNPDKPVYPVGEGCVIDPDGSGYKADGGGGFGHGRLVWSTITDALEQEGARLISGPVNTELWEVFSDVHTVNRYRDARRYNSLSQKWEVPNIGYIRLIPIDSGDFDTATIADGIEQELSSIEKYGDVIEGIVINMSWVILPAEECELPQSAQEYRDMVCDITSDADSDDIDALRVIEELIGVDAPENICTGENRSLFENPRIQNALRVHLISGKFNAMMGQNSFVDNYVDDYTIVDGPLFDLLENCGASNRDNTEPPVEPGINIPGITRVPGNTDGSDTDILGRSQVNRGTEPSGSTSNSSVEVERDRDMDPTCPVDIPVIPIGAAGNAGWQFPMMPALWDSVVSTSAEEGLPDELASCNMNNNAFCSNFAEVKLSGTHPYEDALLVGNTSDCVPGFDCKLYEDQVKGTSYAAPRLSVLAALYLVRGGEVPCTDQLVTDPKIFPPLGYNSEWKPKDNTEQSNRNIPLRVEGIGNDDQNINTWLNLTVQAASDAFCTSFLGK